MADKEYTGLEKPAFISVGKSKKIIFDGHFSHSKYAFASNGVFAFGGSMNLTDINFNWGLYRDDKALVIGLSSPAGSPFYNNQRSRDGKIWEDDSYEVFLTTLDGKNGFHFIYNFQGEFYDAKIVNRKEYDGWNGIKVKVKNKIIKGFWSSELYLPWEEIGYSSKFKLAIYRNSPGKRCKEGVGQAAIAYYEPNNFPIISMDDTAPTGYLGMNLQLLRQGKLLPELFFPQTKNSKDVRFTVGVTEFNAEVNDAYNRPKENILFVQDIGSRVNSKSFTLPERGTIRQVLQRNGKTVFERRLPYNLQEFNKLNIASIWVGNKRKSLYVQLNTPSNSGNAVYELTLIAKEGKIVSKTTGNSEGKITAKVPLKKVLPGKYILNARLLTSTGRELKKDTGNFTFLPSKPEWWNNKLGMTNGKVPPPWTPIEVKDNIVSVLGRTFSFRNKGLPEKITGPSGLIAENLRFVSDNKVFKTERFNWESIKGDITCFDIVYELKGNKIIVKGQLEFDGCTWLNCRFYPAVGRAFPSVAFKYDVPAKNASLAYTGKSRAANNGEITESWNTNFSVLPYFWVGNDKGGLVICSDNIKGWQLPDYRSSVKVSPVLKNARTVELKLLSSKCTKPDKTYQLEFAIQPTPVKSLPHNWRNLHINGTDKNMRVYQDKVTQLFNVPVPLDKYAAGILAKYRRKGINALPYLALLCISPYIDEYINFSESWRVTPRNRPPFKPANYSGLTYICPEAEGYNDYYLSKLNAMINQLGNNGLYFDYAQPTVYPCANKIHGCGYVDNLGNQRSSFRIKATRELAKRIYVLMKNKKPESFIVHHNSGGLIMPVHGFSDLTWNGEQYVLRLFNNNLNYHQIFELNRSRVEDRHEPWGVLVCHLPQFLRAIQIWDKDRYGKYSKIGWKGLVKAWYSDPAGIAATWHLAGLTLAYDGMFSGDWGAGSRAHDIIQMQKKLGWNDSVKFYGYFDPNNPFKKLSPANPNVVVSAYKAPRGYLIVVMNDTEKTHTVKFELPKKLFNKKLTDGITGNTIIVAGNKLSLKVQPWSPRIILSQETP